MALQQTARTPQNQPSLTALYRRPLVCDLTGKSRSALYRDISKGLFTAPVNIGGGRVGWPGYEVEQINKARIAGADDDALNNHLLKQVGSNNGLKVRIRVD
jgi:predicted DNA-binding transcriptional regulator AlpA